MNPMQYQMQLQQALGGFGSFLGNVDPLVTVVLVIGLLTAILFRRQYVEDKRLFRMATVLLAAAIGLPPILTPVFSFYIMNNTGAARQVEMPMLVAVVFNAVGPVLKGSSLICLVNSIIPRSFAPPEPLVPPKHPLDA